MKPSRVSVLVRDLETGESLQPVEWNGQLSGSADGHLLAGNGYSQPFYSLQANRLYAVQCQIDDSRPRSQVHWFNRTAPVNLEPVELDGADFELPAPQRELAQPASSSSRPLSSPIEPHRLSSFSRSVEHANGTFR